MQFAMKSTKNFPVMVLKGTVTYESDEETSLGKIPAGSTIIRRECSIKTAFNGGGAALTVGDGTTADEFMAAGDITEGSTGTYLVEEHVAVASDTEVIVTHTEGTTPSTGEAHFSVWYV